MHREYVGANGAQAELLRVPLADGTLVATPDIPSDDLIPSLLAASDVLGTGWFGAVAAEAGPGKTVAVVGDGAVGTQQSMMQAIRATRPGGHVGYVGVAHGVELPGEELFYSHVHLHGGPAPVRRFLPELTEAIWNREIDPGRVFDLTLPLGQAAEATAPWTSARPSRHCCARDPLNKTGEERYAGSAQPADRQGFL